MSRKFRGRLFVDFEVDINQEVFDAVDDEFREILYNLRSDEEIVEHVVSCVLRGMSLSWLDGWADQPDTNVFVVDDDWQLDELKEIDSD